MFEQQDLETTLGLLSVAIGTIMEDEAGEALMTLPRAREDRLQRFQRLGQAGRDIEAIARSAEVCCDERSAIRRSVDSPGGESCVFSGLSFTTGASHGQEQPLLPLAPGQPGFLERKHENGEHITAADLARVVENNPEAASGPLINSYIVRALRGELSPPSGRPSGSLSREARIVVAGYLAREQMEGGGPLGHEASLMLPPGFAADLRSRRSLTKRC